MPDVTFVRGYGFPRGSSMDYAGYARGGALGTYERPGGMGADGCPIDTVRVGNRCVPFSQLNGYAGDCGCGCKGAVGGCGGGAQPVALGRFAGRRRVRYLHEASLFSTIPSLDGYGADDFPAEEIEANPVVGPDQPTAEQWTAMKAAAAQNAAGGAAAVGFGLLALGAYLFLR